jgi:hypothetical protein
MMEFAQGDPEIVNICLKAVEDDMPLFLYSEIFLKMCFNCVYTITQHDRIFAPEEIIFERVLKWSAEECKRKDCPFTAKNQRKVLGDILLEIRFPIMDHQYLEDVVCVSKVLHDGEKLDILRQQLKCKKKKPGKYKVHQRTWQPRKGDANPLTSFKTVVNFVQTSKRYSLKFEVSSHSFLLGIYLNIKSDTGSQVGNCFVVSTITPLEMLGDKSMETVNEFSTPISEVEGNLVKLYPRFILLRKDVQYTVSVRFHLHAPSKYSGLNIILQNTKPLYKYKLVACTLNDKLLSYSEWPNDQLIEGLWIA